MYYNYYGLNQPPFRITPDTSLFFPGGERGAILDALIYAIVSGEGIVKLVGEVGSGKTTLCRMLEQELPKNVEVVYLANPSLSPDNILHAIAFELHLKVRPDDSRLKVMNSLQNYLLERHAENKQVVVFVEEAQSMPIATLEEIRLLSNLETAQNKLLQIVIFGQPELDVMISKQEIRQLKERITYSFYLSPLKTEEVKDYINTRLRNCGYRSVELFNDASIKLIAKYSKGLLRRINILADKSLLAGYADNVSTITAKHVKKAAKETEFVGANYFSVLRWGLGGLSVLLVCLAIFYLKGIDTSVINPVEISTNNDLNSDKKVVLRSDGDNPSNNNSLILIENKPDDEINIKQENDIKTIYVNHDSVFESAEKFIVSELRPNSSELATPDWQKIDSPVYVYDHSTSENDIKVQAEKITQHELLEIQDLIRNVRGHNGDEEILLKQLKILPSAAFLNNGSVANDQTCELCVAFIYRPLPKQENL